MQIRITSRREVAEINTILVDSEIDVAHISYNSPDNALDIVGWAIEWSLSEYERIIWPFCYRIHPRRHWSLSIYDIINWSMISTGSARRGDWHTFGMISLVGNKYTIDTYDGVSIQVVVSAVNGTLDMSDDIDWSKPARSICMCATEWPGRPPTR